MMIVQLTGPQLRTLAEDLQDAHTFRINPRSDGVALKVNGGMWTPTIGVVEVADPPRPVSEGMVLAFEAIAQDIYDRRTQLSGDLYRTAANIAQDAAFEETCEIMVNHLGMDADLVHRISEAAYDRTMPNPSGEFTPQS